MSRPVLHDLALAFTGAVGFLVLSYVAIDRGRLGLALVLGTLSMPFTFWMNRLGRSR